MTNTQDVLSTIYPRCLKTNMQFECLTILNYIILLKSMQCRNGRKFVFFKFSFSLAFWMEAIYHFAKEKRNIYKQTWKVYFLLLICTMFQFRMNTLWMGFRQGKFCLRVIKSRIPNVLCATFPKLLVQNYNMKLLMLQFN